VAEAAAESDRPTQTAPDKLFVHQLRQPAEPALLYRKCSLEQRAHTICPVKQKTPIPDPHRISKTHTTYPKRTRTVAGFAVWLGFDFPHDWWCITAKRKAAPFESGLRRRVSTCRDSRSVAGERCAPSIGKNTHSRNVFFVTNFSQNTKIQAKANPHLSRSSARFLRFSTPKLENSAPRTIIFGHPDAGVKTTIFKKGKQNQK